MKRELMTWIVLFPTVISAQNVGIGTVQPHPSARLEVDYDKGGILIPRLTTNQRDAIQNPAHSLIIFNIDSFCLETYDTTSKKWYVISCPINCSKPSCEPKIYGQYYACTGTTIKFTVTGCQNTIYQWEVPTSWTIISGQSEDTLIVIPDINSGYVKVKACNVCGCSKQDSLWVVVNECSQFCMTIGGANDDWAFDVINTNDGGFITVGYTNSFGQGNSDVYIVKLDNNRNIEWTRTIGGTGNDEGYAIYQTSDNNYIIAGSTSSFGEGNYDAYLLKIDNNGNIIWTLSLGGINNDHFRDVIETSDGGFIAVGSTETFGAGGSDVYIAKISKWGTVQWTKTFGGTGLEISSSVQETRDNGYIIAGLTGSYGQGGLDMMLIKLNSLGNIEWAKTIGGTGWDYATSAIETNDGGFVLAGMTASFGPSLNNVYVVKLDSLGNLAWTFVIGGNMAEEAADVIETNAGELIVVGKTFSYGMGTEDVYIVKLSPDGRLIWANTIGGGDSDEAFAVKETIDGGFIICGATNSYGNGGMDIYLIKTDSNGVLQCPTGCNVNFGGIDTNGGIPSSISLNTGYGGIINTGGLMNIGGTINIICP